MKKAVQQFMLGTVMNNEKQARETLQAMKAAGYDIDYMDAETFTTYLTESAAAFKTIVEEAGLVEEIGG